MSLKNYFYDFINLFYPEVCAVCSESLLNNEKIICTKCYFDLPRLKNKSEIEKVFWGRVKIEKAYSFIEYQKGGKFQELIHQFKYKGKKEIGFELGKRFAQEINKELDDIDILIPVPLYWKKLKKRGYNQAEWIAKGIEEASQIPLKANLLERQIENPTQTKKSRYHRWENVDGIFKLQKNNNLENKYILLVDDVLTTGSTLEACCNAILAVENTKVSIFTLGFA